MGLALARANFTGTFIAADLSQAALDECEELLMPVNHQFRINTWNGSVLEKTLPSADLIILNHALDDILLFSYVASQNVASASVSEESEYQSVERLRQSWQQGEAWMRAHLDEIAGKLAAQLTQARKPGGQVMIRQYEGYQEKLHNLTIAVELAQLLHDKLITALGKLAWATVRLWLLLPAVLRCWWYWWRSRLVLLLLLTTSFFLAFFLSFSALFF